MMSVEVRITAIASPPCRKSHRSDSTRISNRLRCSTVCEIIWNKKNQWSAKQLF